MNGSGRELTELMREGDWLRRFVATLVPRQDVDDVVQSTWLAALQGGTVTRSVRNWMCGAAVNISRLLHRKSARGARAMRHVAANAAQEPAAADLVEALEVQRLLSEALLALPEPTRTILVLRYQQRLPVETIAAQVGLQPAAVRQRLHRGREAVRERLQQRFGADWRGCVAVTAFVRGNVVLIPAAAAVAVAVGGVAAAALAVTLLASMPSHEPTAPGARGEVTSAPGVAADSATTVAAERTVDVARIAVAPLAQEPAPSPVPKPRTEIRGRVVAAEDQQPLAGVRLTPTAGYEAGVPAAERTKLAPLVTGADGAFAIPCTANMTRLDVWFRADGRSPLTYDAATIEPTDLGDVPMHRGFEVKGRLLDEKGAPAAHVRLEVSVPCAFPDQGRFEVPCTTNELGEFAWGMLLPAGPTEIRSKSEDRELIDGAIEVLAKTTPNEFVLHCRPLPSISGVAFDVDGTPCADLEIRAFDGPFEPPNRLAPEVGDCRTKEDGSFTLHRRKGDSDQVDLRSSMLFAQLDLFEPQTGVRWGTSGLRLQVRPHADVELHVVDAELRIPIERFVAMWTFAKGTMRFSSGGNQPIHHAGGVDRLGRLAHGTRILVWSADARQAQVEVTVKPSMRGRSVIEVALPRLQSFPCVIVDGDGKPLTGTFHVLDRNGTPAPQPWTDPRGGPGRVGTEWDVYRLHTVVTDRDGKGTILAPGDGRDLVVVRDGPDVRTWTPITLPAPGRTLRIVVAD